MVFWCYDKRQHHFEIQLRKHRSDLIIYISILLTWIIKLVFEYLQSIHEIEMNSITFYELVNVHLVSVIMNVSIIKFKREKDII